MGKDIESWLNQEEHRQRFNAGSLKLPSNLRMQNASIPSAIPCIAAAPSNHALPAWGYSELPIVRPEQPKQPDGWFYCLPYLRHGRVQNAIFQEKVLSNANLCGSVPNGNFGVANIPMPAIRRAPKQFLVFDQTGNKTTMMFSSGVGTQMQGYSSQSSKPTHCRKALVGQLGIARDGHHIADPILTDELYDDHVSDEESELREDSEEIDALLYSDDEGNYSDDSEETSTGHSPGLMSAHEKQNWFDEDDTDDVASSAGPPVKRQKRSESSSEVPSVTNDVSSVNRSRVLEYDDDAESSCAGGRSTGSFSDNKRLRNEKIRETVSILQTIIPGGKGKDAIMVLDEAIYYLQTLKFKAKSLGLSAL